MHSILDSCTPRPDIVQGSFNPEIFTASLSQVLDHYRGRDGAIANLYTDAEQFFRDATFPTDSMRRVVSEVLARLSGDNSVPALHRLETAFGGGKTHLLIALMHLGFCGAELAEPAAASINERIFDPRNLHAAGEVDVVAIAGDEIPVHKPQGVDLVPYTLWGEIAFQLGGEALYRDVETEATSHAAPGKHFLNRVFGGRRVLLLLDEMAQYSARLAAAYPQGAGQLAAFLMALSGYARGNSGIALVMTLASHADAFAGQTEELARVLSDIRGEDVSPADAVAMAQAAEAEVLSVVSRDASGVVPVQASEISRVLAKRLFTHIDPSAADATIDAYMQLYRQAAELLPERTDDDEYRKRLRDLYPFHPTFIAFLNGKMAMLANFQGTRGVLRVLALAVRSLWERKQPVPMIHGCHLNLRDARIVNELISRTGAAELLPILNTDIGGVDTGMLQGGVSRAMLADRANKHPAGHPFHEYAWQVVFLHSLVGRHEGLESPAFGISARDALLEVSFPGLAPSHVQAALDAIENADHGAFYLRHSADKGRYYASLDASINRALATIRANVSPAQETEFLDTAARKILTADAVFQVAHDVTQPEHIPDRRGDKTGRPTIGMMALGAREVDPEAFVTTVGANRPRIEQNLVFLLVPRVVHAKGEVWREDRVARAQDARARLRELASDVIARNRLRKKPEDYGIKPRQLAEEGFEAKTKERALALQTTLTQLYDGLWYPSASGQVIRKEIHTAGGEGGASIIEEIHRVLREDGELITEDRARTQEIVTGVGKLFFGTGQTPTLSALRRAFAEKRTWPVLASSGIFDQLIREGVGRGAWCLFRLDDEQSTKPAEVYSRDGDPLPLDLDLAQAGWSIITVQGAKQRGWLGGAAVVDPDQVEGWVRDAIKQQPAAYVSDLIAAVTGSHGEIPEKDILTAIDNFVREEKAAAYTGEVEQTKQPAELMHGKGAIMAQVGKDQVIVSAAEAARRGWITVVKPKLDLKGRGTANQLVQLLKRIGSLYMRGASSRVDLLDLVGLDLPNGGQLRLQLKDCSPEDMKRLGELFEVLGGLVSIGAASDARLRINELNAGCKFADAVQAQAQEQDDSANH
jgi:hypothetical protein